jgi:hypothetical protein
MDGDDVCWKQQAQDRVQWRALLLAVLTLGLRNAERLWTGRHRRRGPAVWTYNPDTESHSSLDCFLFMSTSVDYFTVVQINISLFYL